MDVYEEEKMNRRGKENVKCNTSQKASAPALCGEQHHNQRLVSSNPMNSKGPYPHQSRAAFAEVKHIWQGRVIHEASSNQDEAKPF